MLNILSWDQAIVFILMCENYNKKCRKYFNVKWTEYFDVGKQILKDFPWLIYLDLYLWGTSLWCCLGLAHKEAFCLMYVTLDFCNSTNLKYSKLLLNFKL